MYLPHITFFFWTFDLKLFLDVEHCSNTNWTFRTRTKCSCLCSCSPPAQTKPQCSGSGSGPRSLNTNRTEQWPVYALGNQLNKSPSNQVITDSFTPLITSNHTNHSARIRSTVPFQIIQPGVWPMTCWLNFDIRPTVSWHGNGPIISAV